MEQPQRVEPSRGVVLSRIMLALIVIECLALTEIVFFDRASWSSGSSFVGPYYVICVGTLVLQVAGMMLVGAGRYRLGGVLQMVASSIHLVKVEGMIGIVGGIQAYRYPGRRGR